MFLDANESADAPSPRMNRYPEPQPAALVARFSDLYGVPPETIVVGRGSDEAIDLLVRTFCEREDRVTICPPTYGVYAIAAAIAGCEIERVPLRELGGTFALDMGAIESRAGKLVFLCSPNNPTGTAFDGDAIVALAEHLRGRSIVVVDEAYIEFSERASLAPLVARAPNLVVLRTLSKAWALAGARVGVALAHAEIATLLHRVRAPYPISTPQLDATLVAIAPEREAELRARVVSVRGRRAALAAALARAPGVVNVWPSDANFVLARFTPAAHAQLFERVRQRGIVLRDRSTDIADTVRITVGSDAECAAVTELLR
jgi:histidinol-phosphate aminotransferase